MPRNIVEFHQQREMVVSACIELIHRNEFKADRIVSQFPPNFHNLNKKTVYSLSCPDGCTHGGTITFSRWRPSALPNTLLHTDGQTLIQSRDGYFEYGNEKTQNISWHLNFAHYDLFSSYAGGLFAQDEMQVTEHPALASLRNVLLHEGIPPLTVENRVPTPALIHGVQRRCIIHTDRNPAAGRPDGLYGNNFAHASELGIRQATELLVPPTVSNILAMEAPAGGYGKYNRDTIMYIFTTAATGFSAAIAESERIGFAKENVEIHTGYWGCGAYGGNPVLMLLLQMVAAVCSNVGTLHIYLGGNDSREYQEARHILGVLLPTGRERTLNEVIEEIDSMSFKWGVSNGT